MISRYGTKARRLRMSLYLALALCFAVLFSPIVSVAEGGVSVVEAPVTVRVAANHFPPWVISDGNQFAGIDIEILNAISEQTGINFSFVECPWQRCLKMLETGSADLIPGVFRSAERERYMAFIEPPYYIDPPKVFYLKQDNPKTIESYEDLQGISIGVIYGTLYFPEFDQDTSLNKQRFTREEQLPRLLNAGRIDAFISTEVQAELLIQGAGLEGAFRSVHLGGATSHPSYFAVSRRASVNNLEETLSQAFNKMKASGQLRAIISKGLQAPNSDALPTVNLR